MLAPFGHERITARMRILVGDIGGTNSRLALWEDGLQHQLPAWPSAAFDGLRGPVEAWLEQTGVRPDAACFAVAGPVVADRCSATNLPWIVDRGDVEAWLGVPVRVINDFHAAARGVRLLGPTDVAAVLDGVATAGPIAVLGAGTGLGEAFVIGDHVVPGEGGHAEFGPTDARERAFSAWLQERYGRAAWEHVLSGPGLVNLARFTLEGRGADTTWLDTPSAPAEVTRRLPDVVEWFAALYGAEAGNMALRVLARSVYLCGGIAPNLLPTLRGDGFRRRFFAKGKVAEAIRGVPVWVVTHPSLGLLGAAAEVLPASE